VLSTVPPLATPPPPQHHNIPPTFSSATLYKQDLDTLGEVSLRIPGLISPSLSQPPRAPRLSPRTPEQETSLGLCPHEAGFDSQSNLFTSLKHHEAVHQPLGYHGVTSSSQGYLTPNFSRAEPQRQFHTSSLSASPCPSNSAQLSSPARPLAQITPSKVSSRNRRKHDRQLKCTYCLKVFQRHCDLK